MSGFRTLLSREMDVDQCCFMSFNTVDSFTSFLKSTKLADIRTLFFSLDENNHIVPLRSLPRCCSTQDDILSILDCMAALKNISSCFVVRTDFSDDRDSQWMVGYCFWDESSRNDSFMRILQVLFPDCRPFVYSNPRTIEKDIWVHLFPEYGHTFSHFVSVSTYCSDANQSLRRRSNKDVLSPPTLEKYNKGASKRTKSFPDEPIRLSDSYN